MNLLASFGCILISLSLGFFAPNSQAAKFELHDAVSNHESETLRSLLTQRDMVEKINAQENENGWTALHLSVIHQCVPCLKLLIGAGADPFALDFYEKTPLAYAIVLESSQMKGHLVYRLLEAQCHWPPKQSKRNRWH